jgi:transposase
MTTVEPRMNARPTPGQCSSRAYGLPAIRPTSLAQTVQAAARAVDPNTVRPVAPHDGKLGFQPATLLTVLAYCYAMQIYGSADVEALLRSDSNLRPLCPDQFPTARMIRRFRRENRESLQVCLEAALHFVAQQKVAQGLLTKVNEARIAEEARRRIIVSMFTDSMELDKDTGADTPTDLCYLIAKQ